MNTKKTKTYPAGVRIAKGKALGNESNLSNARDLP